MPRHPRAAAGGYVYHCLNRAVARLPLFQKDGDYDAFERVLVQALEKHPIQLLAYCIMPNHWHFVLWPEIDGDRLSPLADSYAHATLARPLPYFGHRPPLPGPFQVFSHPGRRSPLHGASVRGKESAAGQAGCQGRGVALVQPSPAATKRAHPPLPSPLARARAKRLAGARPTGRNGSRTGSRASRG